MGKSAKMLGTQFNLTGEEMNELFRLNGFLEGKPGDYQVTNAGEPYATERDEHRGTGGYAWYNKYWTERTWDDSVLDALDTSPEMIQEARENVSERRRAGRMASIRSETEAEEAPCLDEDEETDEYEYSSYIDPATAMKGAAIVGAIIATIVAAPHIKKFFTEKVKPAFKQAWCKLTKKPYESPDTPELEKSQPVISTEQEESVAEPEGDCE